VDVSGRVRAFTITVLLLDSILEFLAMGGYAAYVWPSIGLTALVMIGLAWLSWRGLRREEAAVAALESQMRQGDAAIKEEDSGANGST